MGNNHKVKIFEGMKYQLVQRKNSRNRDLLSKKQQKWLRDNKYRNVGWNNVINLFKKLKDIQQEDNIKSLNLEELFLEADRIGDKYLNRQEIDKRNLAMSQELEQIANRFDEQFPDNTVEVIDYARTSRTRK